MPANTRTTPAKKTAAARRDKPAPIGFSLKDVERDPNEVPFVVAVKGRPIESVNPLDVDYQELYESQADMARFFALVFPDDHEDVIAEFNTVRSMVALANALSTHYGLEDFLAAQS